MPQAIAGRSRFAILAMVTQGQPNASARQAMRSRRNVGVPLIILWAVLVAALRVRHRLGLPLASAAILIIFPVDGSEHVQHDAVDGGLLGLGPS